MKPYFLVIHNYLKLTFYKMFVCKEISFEKVQLLSRQTRLRLSTDARLELGDHMITDGHSTLVVNDGGKLIIGGSVYLNEGCMISCKEKIEIGQGCQLGPGVMIFDNNHKYDAINGVQSRHSTGEIKIGKNCWLAANVVVLKGTVIEDNCIIGAGCIISGYIPQGSVVTGSRELTIQKIEEKEK